MRFMNAGHGKFRQRQRERNIRTSGVLFMNVDRARLSVVLMALKVKLSQMQQRDNLNRKERRDQ